MAGVILLARNKQQSKRDAKDNPGKAEAEPSCVSTSSTALNNEGRDDNEPKGNCPDYLKGIESTNEGRIRRCLMGAKFSINDLQRTNVKNSHVSIGAVEGRRNLTTNLSN